MSIVYGCDDRRLEQVKTRYGYVSNSSSSSYIILNWSSLDDHKKDMILNYTKHVRRLWDRHGIPVEQTNSNDAHIDMDAVRASFPPDDVIDDIQKNIQWHKEHEEEFKLSELAQDLDFGWLDDYWRFREKDGRLEMTTSMDNFDMEKWMDYVGGIEYEWTGECFGLFDDEKIEFDSSILDRLADSNFRRNMDDGNDEGTEGLHQDA